MQSRQVLPLGYCLWGAIHEGNGLAGLYRHRVELNLSNCPTRLERPLVLTLH